MTKRVIASLHSETSGWIHSFEGEIIEISKNGEMAPVPWYLQKLKDGAEIEINGKYVTYIRYELTEVLKEEAPF